MADAAQPRRELSRELGLPSVFSIAVGTMIGAGVFVLPGVAVAIEGEAAVASFLLAALVAFTTGLSASELATAMPRAGGTYHFLDRALGPATGSVAGLGTWALSVLKGAFAAVAFAFYLNLLLEVPIAPVALLLAFGLLAINAIGVRHTGIIQSVIVLVVLAGMTLFAILGLSLLKSGVADAVTPDAPAATVLATAGLVLFGYVGIIKATAVAEEVRNPDRDLPWGILLSLTVVTVLYLVVVGVEAALPQATLHSLTAIVDVGGLLLGGPGAFAVAVTGVLALASMANASILAAARYGYAMAHDRMIPRVLGEVSRRFSTPHVSILATGIPMLLIIALLDVILLAELTSVFAILLFFLYNVAVLVMRRSSPEWYAPSFRSPGYPYVQILGMAGGALLLAFMGWLEQLVALAFVLGGVGWYLAYSRGRTAPRGEFREVVRREVARRAVVGAEEKVAERGLRVLLPIDSPEHGRDLLQVVRWLTGERTAHVRAVKVEEVPEQTPLHDVESLPGQVPEALQEEVARDAQEFGLDAEFVELFAHDYVAGLLTELAGDYDILILDWDAEIRHGVGHRGLRRLIHNRWADTLIFRDRGLHEREDVLLASHRGPYDSLEVAVANGAAAAGGRVTLLRVLPPEAPEAQEETEAGYHRELREILRVPAKSRIVRSARPAAAIVTEARQHDLVVMRVAREPKVGEATLGRIVEEVLEATDGSLLLTSEAETQRRRLLRWVLHRGLG